MIRFGGKGKGVSLLGSLTLENGWDIIRERMYIEIVMEHTCSN